MFQESVPVCISTFNTREDAEMFNSQIEPTQDAEWTAACFMTENWNNCVSGRWLVLRPPQDLPARLLKNSGLALVLGPVIIEILYSIRASVPQANMSG